MIKEFNKKREEYKIEMQVSMEMVKKYRDNLVEYGKKVSIENPDKLNDEEMMALLDRIFSQINEIDMSLGYEYHAVPVSLPKSITKDRQEELFLDFIDWYQVIDTPSSKIYKYVTKNYDAKRYPKILCVGDGENCHLGRKLAMAGYNAVSVDPLARKVFSTKIGNGQIKNNGSLHVTTASFFDNSSNMIEWADVIVGSKVPLCAEALIAQKKPAIFSISNNVEIYNMKFKGQQINSSQELVEAIRKCPSVRIEREEDNRPGDLLFVCNERQREEER